MAINILNSSSDSTHLNGGSSTSTSSIPDAISSCPRSSLPLGGNMNKPSSSSSKNDVVPSQKVIVYRRGAIIVVAILFLTQLHFSLTYYGPRFPTALLESNASFIDSEVVTRVATRTPQSANDISAGRLLASPPREEDRQGIVLLANFHGAGYNNQRQTIQGAVWAAHVLNRTLYMPVIFRSSKHTDKNRKSIRIDSVYNLTTLRNLVPIKTFWVEKEYGERQELCRHTPRNVEFDFFASNPPASPEELQRVVSGLSVNTSVIAAPIWLYVDGVLQFGGSFGLEREEFWGYFDFTDVIKQCADDMVNRLLRKECKDGLHGVHMRVSDRLGLPLFDASRGPAVFNRTVVDERDVDWNEVVLNAMFLDTKRFITVQDVFLKDHGPFPLTPDACVYVATDQVDHNKTQQFLNDVRKWGNGTRSILYSDLEESHLKDADSSCRSISPSMLEQAILSRVPGRYVASWFVSRIYQYYCVLLEK
jgi:hypothetical protein